LKTKLSAQYVDQNILDPQAMRLSEAAAYLLNTIGGTFKQSWWV